MSANLTADLELLLLLLDTTNWRERVVEEFVFGLGEHVRVTSTYQFGIAEEWIAAAIKRSSSWPRRLARRPAPSRVRLLLPVTTRDKRPLLNFTLTGPEQSGALLVPRDLTAQLQATYLNGLLETAGLAGAFGDHTFDLLTAICAFTPARFEQRVRDADEWHGGLAEHLNDGLSFGSGAATVTASDVREWCREGEDARVHLLGRLKEPRDLSSSAEQVMLALPGMSEPPRTRDEIDEVVNRYHQAVVQLAALGGPAEDLLRLLAEYGRRWQVFVEAEIPVGERFKLRLADDRPLNPELGRTSRQRFALNDALSGHLEARVVDHSVVFDDWSVRDLLDREIDYGQLEAKRLTDEAGSLYSSIPERPALVHVDVRLKLRREIATIPWLFGIVTLLATVAAALLPAGPHDDLFAGLAVLALPVTLTAALLILREQTALAARLQTWPRYALGVLTALLWIVVIARLLLEGVTFPPW